jgi:hypothetical protein
VLDPNLELPVRRALVEGFPYALVFVVLGDSVQVLAMAHLHRIPGYWLQRLRSES